MSRNKWLVLALSVSIAMSACAKKQTTPVKQEEPKIIPPPIERPVEPVEQPPAVQEQKPVALEDVFFDFDKYSIGEEYRGVLTRNAEALLANPAKKLLVEGHCDERGTNEYNLALGERRAKAVIDFYVAYGVPADRLTWVSFGEEKPFASGSSEDAWAKNRRAHMVVQ